MDRCEDVALQVCQRFEVISTNSRVGLKVAVVDGLDQLLSDFNDLLLPSWDTETKKNKGMFD